MYIQMITDMKDIGKLYPRVTIVELERSRQEETLLLDVTEQGRRIKRQEDMEITLLQTKVRGY